MATDATLPFVIVDAFTSVRFGGNPAAVVVLPREEPGKRRHAPPPDGIKWEYGVMPASHELSGRDGWPPDLFLQDVAREMNLSETAFVREKLDRRRTVGRGDDEELFADYDLRWFTPSGAEVDLCGHATLASAHALWDTARVAPFAVIRFHTRSGILPVVPLGEGAAELNFPSAAPNRLLLGAPPEAVRAPPRAPLESKSKSDGDDDGSRSAAAAASDDDDDDDATNNPAGVTPETVAAALGLSNLRADVDGEPTGDIIYPIVAGRNSIGDTFAIYPDPAHVLAARPHPKRIAALGGRGLVVTAPGGVATRQGGARVDFTCRFFAPNIGIHEDPVTGSAFCGLGPYWTDALGIERGKEAVGYQASARGGVVRVAVGTGVKGVKGGGRVEERVSIRGSCVTSARGELMDSGLNGYRPPGAGDGHSGVTFKD